MVFEKKEMNNLPEGVIGVVGHLNIRIGAERALNHGNRFAPYPAAVRVPPLPIADANGLGLLENQHLLIKVERGNSREQVNTMPEPAAFTAAQHLAAVGYEESGILGFFVHNESPIKIQYQWNNNVNAASLGFYNAHCILLRPLTRHGTEINIGDNNGPNHNAGWIFLPDSLVNDYENGVLQNDPDGTRIQHLFVICEFFVNCIFDNTVADHRGGDVRTTGTMPNIFESADKLSQVSTLRLLQFVRHCHEGFGHRDGQFCRFFRNLRGVNAYPPNFEGFFGNCWLFGRPITTPVISRQNVQGNFVHEIIGGYADLPFYEGVYSRTFTFRLGDCRGLEMK